MYMRNRSRFCSGGDKKSRGRRKSVCAERYDPEQEENRNEKWPVWHKTAEQKQRLSQAVREVFLLKRLEQDQLHHILDAMSERKVVAGECIIRQGDDGDNFYIIDSGFFDVFIDSHTEGEEKKCVAHYDNRGSFGELALMYNTCRTATVVAKTDGILWALDRHTFRRIVLKGACNKRQKYERLLQSVPQLQTLTSYERSNVADALVSQVYSDGQRIIKENDDPDGMYFIEDGTVRVSVTNELGAEVPVSTLTAGHYFGELALVTHQKRSASIYAVGDVKVAFLDVAAFERLLGPCVDIMKRDISLYEEQLSAILGSQAKIRQ